MFSVDDFKLTFSDPKLSEEPGISEWLETCEKIIKDEMREKNFKFISIDYVSLTEVVFTTSR